MKYRCDNCSYTADEKQFAHAKDLSMRLSPGGTYTDLECPKPGCGALAFPVEAVKRRSRHDRIHDALHAALFYIPRDGSAERNLREEIEELLHKRTHHELRR